MGMRRGSCEGPVMKLHRLWAENGFDCGVPRQCWSEEVLLGTHSFYYSTLGFLNGFFFGIRKGKGG